MTPFMMPPRCQTPLVGAHGTTVRVCVTSLLCKKGRIVLASGASASSDGDLTLRLHSAGAPTGVWV